MKILLLIFILHYVCNSAFSLLSNPEDNIDIVGKGEINIPNESKKKALDITDKKYKKIFPLKSKIKITDPKYVTYTAFPPPNPEKIGAPAPASYFYPAENVQDPKVRVKKVLSENLRRKREAKEVKPKRKPSAKGKPKIRRRKGSKGGRRKPKKSARSGNKTRSVGRKGKKAKKSKKVKKAKASVPEAKA